MRSYEAWRTLLEGRPLPAAVLDLDAVDHNLDVLLRAMAAGPSLRLATKSLRVPDVVLDLIARHPRLRGLMTYSAHETRAYATRGADDLLLAYPIGRADEAVALAAAATRATVRAVVDDIAQARLLSDAAVGAGVELGVCLDIDVSWRPAGGRAHLGVRRSPLRDAASAVALAREVRRLDGLRVDAIMAYEAQVAGLRDRSPGGGSIDGLLDGVKRFIKRTSAPLAAQRRVAVREALEAAGLRVTLVNGGGTGSVRQTSRDGSVTEVTAGSGLFCPHLFDGYDGLPLQPAAFFALSIVRRSDPDFVTAAGGGYIASGAAGADRLPIVHAPPGLTPLGVEGFGEVQTPFQVGAAAPPLALGDPVVCRHAKSGELFERFNEALLVRGTEIVGSAPTLRGLGHAFL